MSSIIEKVETFIQRLHDLDYSIAPEAIKIIYDFPSKEKKSLTDCLANAIYEYEANKDNEQVKLHYAQLCLIWINRAFACGVIEEAQGLAKKLGECRERNTQLERDIETLSVQYLQLQREHEEFMKRIRLPDEGNLENTR